MATEKQHDFFKNLFLSEEERTKGLRETAKTYLTLSTLYSAFVLFVTEKLHPTSEAAKAIFAVTIGAVLLSFLLALLVLQVSRFEAPSHPDLVFEDYGETEPSDAEFLDARIIDYSLAYEANSEVNDRKARLLAAAGFGMLLGLSAHASFFLWWLYRPGEFHGQG